MPDETELREREERQARKRKTASSSSSVPAHFRRPTFNPAALLLSGFTTQWKPLIVGCNLGGLGTLIASMASLISYKMVAREYPGQGGRYLLWFTLSNLILLFILLAVSCWL